MNENKPLIKENSAKYCKIIQHLTTNFIKKTESLL